MKVTVVIPGPLFDVSRGKKRIELETTDRTVRGAFASLKEALPAVYDRLMTEQSELRPHVNVFVGAEDIRWTDGLGTALSDGAEVYVLPSVSGG